MTLSCFELGEHMLSVEDARQALSALIERPLASEVIDLSQAHGRRLAQNVVAPINVPQNTNAAMDGVALAWPDTPQHQWSLIGNSLAGRPFDAHVPPGACVRITTGAPLPPGTDTVIMREQLTEHAQHLSIDTPEGVKRGQNVRKAGEDIAAGSLALAKGKRLDASALGLLASLGVASISVVKQPTVALFSTGDEVTAPGEPLESASIYDANRFTLMGLLTEQGAKFIDLGILPDNPQAIEAALSEAAQVSDLVLTSGGVSAGQADFTRVALEQLGQLAFWRVALRPGRPLACGWLGETRTPFMGLPGNPVAVMVTFYQFVVPLLRHLQALAITPPPRLYAVADEALKSRYQRTDFLRGIYHSDAQGVLHVRTTGAQGSGILSSMVAANCLIELPEDQNGAQAGEIVCIQPLLRWQ
ncbi:gephyrin-like molybdotransferase Glp [Vreelandella nanhaiensis]|uniref:Molybdopterin molybdenumtransferase n=1 Tax=Vreelandella nanhaiensis TaxID=1258546 RepID=A0A433KTZ2_9GAMM|nr:gephyrin-like molybdotransferase Glp [Halomonas nanhaiensis]RUR33123.1 molybdopterin molybdenumtransferase MoeA [Halomonas nanhaiensis]